MGSRICTEVNRQVSTNNPNNTIFCVIGPGPSDVGGSDIDKKMGSIHTAVVHTNGAAFFNLKDNTPAVDVFPVKLPIDWWVRW